jgi:transposase
MPRPYSVDLRVRVIGDISTGASRRETEHAGFLLGLITGQPDLTLDEVVAAMRKRGIPGSRSAVWHCFDRRDISFKKTLYAAEQKRAEVARERRRWMRRQGMFDPAQLVFIDESWTNTSMVRLRGRCPHGERLIGYAPLGHWKTITFVTGLQIRAMVAPLVVEGAMNGPMFLAYVKQCLAPTLRRGDIVIMDNVPVHRVAGVKEAIEVVGARLLYLPLYSPDLNPIELAISEVKADLRKACERAIPRLSRRIGRIVADFSAKECRNFFRHAGYVRI